MKITLLRYKLTMLEAFAVAAPETARGGVDRPIASDPRQGEVVVPSSSVAGSLRHHVGQKAPDLVDSLFGPRARPDEQLRSSKLRVVGTRVTKDGMPLRPRDVILRRQTALDRERRAAKTHTLRSSHVAPAGAQVELFIRVDGDLEPDEHEALAGWSPVIGWGRNAGQGRARVDGAWFGVLDLDRTDDLTRWLLEGGPALHEAVATQELFSRSERAPMHPWRTYTFRIVDALHVAGGEHRDLQRNGHPTANSAPDKSNSKQGNQRPRTAANTAWLWRREPTGNPVLEGSTFKGVMRSRAEYIVDSLRSSLGVEAPGGAHLIEELFGSTHRQGKLAFSSTEVRNSTIELRPHVAIDRLTSGARDRQLFQYEVAVGGTFELRIDKYGDIPPAAGELLDAVVRDFHDGLVGIGGHTASGHGTVELADSGHYPKPDWKQLESALRDELTPAVEAACSPGSGG